MSIDPLQLDFAVDYRAVDEAFVHLIESLATMDEETFAAVHDNELRFAVPLCNAAFGRESTQFPFILT